ncbi:aminoglycoside 6-adenylyltransferase [Formosa haliotis]|uniref:aminoglycoside 6-adenylyltransferase n=1 Tax=Formosa haliotis TaxID=1555194 RepID=UPI0008268DC8|nr:aminoglycoside 6-adenylyltransferase [Formosa haliotis]
MRSEKEMKRLILKKAQSEEHIRAVLLNGSRVNSNIKPDKYQDFDVVYIVKDIDFFTSNHCWVDYFGPRLIWQLPDDMNLGNEARMNSGKFTYLMQFTGGNRIDLTLISIDKLRKDFKWDSLTHVWLDKDGLFENVPEANDSDYIIKKPTALEFKETCNEFWWVCTYVGKGLARNEIIYARDMLDTVVRPMFIKMIEWQIGTATNFSVSAGRGGKFIKNYVSESAYKRILKTYSDAQISNTWNALELMMELFGDFAKSVTNALKYTYNISEELHVKQYLAEVKIDNN